MIDFTRTKRVKNTTLLNTQRYPDIVYRYDIGKIECCDKNHVLSCYF